MGRSLVQVLTTLTQHRCHIWPFCIKAVFKSYSKLSCTENVIQFQSFGPKIQSFKCDQSRGKSCDFWCFQRVIFLFPIVRIEWNLLCGSVLSRTWIQLLYTMVKFDPCVAWESSKVAPNYDPPHQSMTHGGTYWKIVGVNAPEMSHLSPFCPSPVFG